MHKAPRCDRLQIRTQSNHGKIVYHVNQVGCDILLIRVRNRQATHGEGENLLLNAKRTSCLDSFCQTGPWSGIHIGVRETSLHVTHHHRHSRVGLHRLARYCMTLPSGTVSLRRPSRSRRLWPSRAREQVRPAIEGRVLAVPS